ncbi:MAG TPA: YafY family protein [Flavisolibacter sp.]|nr:YafY family protein [Flavisolibacter sp.]
MDNDLKRIARLTAVLIQLLSRKLVTAPSLAKKFGVSTRTIYRDLRTLEKAGVPILTEEGKGISLMPGYKIPPVMLSEAEANALLTAELLIQSQKDASLIEGFASVTAKIRAILPDSIKQKTESLESKLGVSNTYLDKREKTRYLMSLQTALTERKVIRIAYRDKKEVKTEREVEPFALFANQQYDWVLIGFCRLRSAFRSFSLSGIEKMTVTSLSYSPQPLSFEQYMRQYHGTPDHEGLSLAQ